MSHLDRDPFPPSVDFASIPESPRSWGQRLAATVRLWRERSAARRALAVLDVRMLRDLGISPGQASFEANQPFWRRPTRLR